MIDEKRTRELLEAARQVEAVFAPLTGRRHPDTEIDSAEKRARSGLQTIYHNLYSMARSALLDHTMVSTGILPGLIHISIDDMAWEVAGIPFEKRKEDGLLEVVHIILGLFEGEPPGGKDVFLYLAGVTRKNVSQTVRRTFRLEDGMRAYIHGAVRSHVSGSPRYRLEDGAVEDLESPADCAQDDPDPGGILSSFDTSGAGAMSPGEIVDAVFDHMAEMPGSAGRISLSSLRRIVHSIYGGGVPGGRKVSAGNPEQEYLRKELLDIARDSVSGTASGYGWKESHPREIRDAFERAGYDYLAEIIDEGTCATPYHELIGRYLPGCDKETYRKEHRGSFQHFLKLLWNDFLENFRAG